MPAVTPIKISLSAPDGRVTHGDAKLQYWEKKDATRKAIQWGLAVFGVGLLMIPIPGVHFFTPFVILIGVPLTTFLIFRLYKTGVDILGRGACPTCGHAQAVGGTAERWPLARHCGECRNSFTIDRDEEKGPA